MASNARDPKIFVIYKATPIPAGYQGDQKEIKVLLYATEDPVLANSERDRLNSGRSTDEIYTQRMTYKVEPLPLLSRRKTRHPFMRGQNQRGLFDPETMDKDGNTDDGHNACPQVEVKTRGRLSRNVSYEHATR